jgi:hypothetical protein
MNSDLALIFESNRRLPDNGNYTEERREFLKGITIDQIVKKIANSKGE